jgi:hypothetical protein
MASPVLDNADDDVDDEGDEQENNPESDGECDISFPGLKGDCGGKCPG